MNDFKMQKIIWGEISDKPKFAFDDGQYYQEATTFLMTGSEPKYLLAFLNSSLSMFFFSKLGTTTGMGTIRWKKYKLEEFPVPKPTKERRDALLPLVNALLEGKKDRLEERIDQAIFNIYNFTQEEQEYIRSFANKA